ncbi:MAG TPA: hypothetical protein VEH55_00830 [Gaiellaceae bacterium]|nr:hypothetical protein [Gaiellaceae bacterium]
MSATDDVFAPPLGRPRGVPLGAFGTALAAAVAAGIAVGAVAYAARTHRAAQPALPELHGEVSWAPGTRPAPGLPALRALRGRTVVLALVGPHCRGCTLMREELASVVRRLPAPERPALAVSSTSAVGAAGAVVYLIDRRGDERTGYLLPIAPSFVERDLRELAAEPAA